MWKACFLATAAFTTGIFAQSVVDPSTTTATSSSSSASSTASKGPKIVEISVGAQLHKFVPDEVFAEVGDTIRFSFYPGGHRVARAEYQQPCIPYENTGALKKGFYTGIISPNVIQNPAPFYDVVVNDTEPIFFYCGAPGSCKEYLMVGVVNPTKEKTLAIQKEYASNSTIQFTPGEPWPSETSSPTPKQTVPSSNSGNGNSSTPSEGGSSGLGTGAIAGIAIGGAAVIILGAALVYLCGRRGGFERAYRKNGAPGIIPGGMVENKYHDPKSPGMATMSSFMGQERDPYRSSTQHQHLGHYPGTPPISPGMPGYGSYPASVGHGHYAPAPMSDSGAYTPHQTPYHTGVPSNSSPLASPQFQPPHFQTTPPPAELAATVDHPNTGNSPPPQYLQPDRRDSFTTGSEGQFRSGKSPN